MNSIKNSIRKLLRWMPDKLYLQLMCFYHFRKIINFRKPITFNEKLQWLKLYDRNPVYTIMVDKIEVKRFVADKIGEKYVIPTLGVYDSIEDIDFDKLPNQFVLKCNHDSKSVCICKDKKSFDIERAKRFLEPRLKVNGYWYGREWPYKNVVPRIFAEKYMEDSTTSELRDYKFFCFNGKPVYCQVISDRTSNETIDFYDMDWQHQSFTGLALPKKPFNNYPVPIPISFDKMKKSAEILSKGIPFVRVDFYEINGKMYFGELTFYPAAGLGVFSPDEWNYKLGDMINLPDKRG